MATNISQESSDPRTLSPLFRIVSWNCRGAIGKKAEIEKLCEDYEVVILTETCLSDRHEFYIRGFRCIRSDCSNPGKRGVAMLVREYVKIRNIDISGLLDPSLEGVAVEARGGSLRTLLVGAYRHPVHNPQHTSLLR